MIAIIPTDESLGAQMRVTAALEAAGLEPESVEAGGAAELDELWLLQHNATKYAEACVESFLKEWEDLAGELLKLDEPLPAMMEEKLRDMIAMSKEKREELP